MKIFHTIRRRIQDAQTQRQQKHASDAVPFELGETVRRKLSTAERGKEGGKLAAFKSRCRYQVVGRNGWTYTLRKLDQSGKTLTRHHNKLERAPQRGQTDLQEGQEEAEAVEAEQREIDENTESESDDEWGSEEMSDVETAEANHFAGTRRSERVKQPRTLLQVDPTRNRYTHLPP
jgi:hypothetical protein